MKRSAQVALVLMGVTGTTATAAYMMPARECRAQPSAASAVAAPKVAAPGAAATPATSLPPGVTPKQPSDCSRSGYRSSYHSWSNWGWHSDRDQRYGATGTPSSVSTALTNGGRVGAVSSTSSSSGSSSSVSRGGFGSTGRGVSVAS